MYLRELAVQEPIFLLTWMTHGHHQTDSDDLRVTGPTRHKWVLSMPLSYGNTLVLFSWKDDKLAVVGDMGAQLQRYADNLSLHGLTSLLLKNCQIHGTAWLDV